MLLCGKGSLLTGTTALLLLGRLVSQIGDGIYYFALTWLVLDLTGSGAVLGSLLMASSLPGILLAPFAGVIIDIVNRKLIIVGADIIRGILILALALVYHSGQVTIPVLYGATVLLSMCGVVFGPAISATIPNLVKKEELVQANARDSFSAECHGDSRPHCGAALLGAAGYVSVFTITGILPLSCLGYRRCLSASRTGTASSCGSRIEAARHGSSSSILGKGSPTFGVMPACGL